MTSVAVVGCGYWGPNLVRNFRSLPACRVPVVCDLDQGRLQAMEDLYPGIRALSDFSAVLEDDSIDALAIATPVRTHRGLAGAALAAGKHVFVEKPLAASVSDCRELIHLARERSLSLMVGHTFVYNSTVQKIKEVIASGELGEVMYISSRRLNLGLFQNDINVAWDLAPHDISIILYVLGKQPVSINCQGKAHVKADIEDVTNMTLNFANGAMAIIQSSWIDPRKIRETTFVGTKKMLVYDDTEPLEKIRIYDKRVVVPPHYETFAEFHYSYHYGDMYAPYVKQVEPLKVECQAFLDSIVDGTPSDSGGGEGLAVVEILEAANRSLKNGGGAVEVHRSTNAVA